MIKIGICGYGNLGKGVLAACLNSKDLEVVGVFTRRNPKDVKISVDGINAYHMDDILSFQNKIDVMILCGGSATDLPSQTPELSKYFNVVDSFDTHANIPIHFKNVNDSALKSDHLSLISTGWDPGMFSLNRVIMESVLPIGNDYTFWGKGVSQGHSDAIRRIEGVLDARQYTIPKDDAIARVRNKENPNLSIKDKHLRECFVVVKEDANKELIEHQIKTMPNYFADYDTIVHFISEDEMKKNHCSLPHGGFVIRSGQTGFNLENKHVIEYSLNLDSNPEFTGSVLASYARAVYLMHKEGNKGCITVFDVAPKYLSYRTYEDLISHLL